jgi:hypothetical protein
MIDTSAEYKVAIEGSTRRIVPKVVIDLIDPDIVYESVTSSGSASYSKPAQLYNKELEVPKRYATPEHNRWVLDGETAILPNSNSSLTDEIGFWGSTLSAADGTLDAWVQINVSNIDILQAASVTFSGIVSDGVGQEFELMLYSGDDIVWQTEVTDNALTRVTFEGFAVYQITAIRLHVTKWSLPNRRMRVAELTLGIYEIWDGDYIYSLEVTHNTELSNTSLPYGTAKVTIRNETRRFDPTNKSSLFLSLEERQPIEIALGVKTTKGYEYVPMGVYYQKGTGWQTSSDGITLTWSLVDIIGLLSSRKFDVPDTLPTTFAEWIKTIVSQLGVNFEKRYIVPDSLADTALTCDADDLDNVKCGDLLRWLGQATGTYIKADAATGYLTCATFSSGESKKTLTRDVMSQNASISANSDVASISFKIGDDQYTIAGTNTAADKTVSVSNPFITTYAQVVTAAKQIISSFGGSCFTVTGRGDMSTEPGDLEAVETTTGVFTGARRYKQTFKYDNGILKNAQSYLVCPSGVENYENYALITESGTVTMPTGVTTCTIVLGGGGSGGSSGTAGNWSSAGEEGAAGVGGKIYVTQLSINSGQTLTVSIGAGGAAGKSGGATTCAGLSSNSGARYSDGYIDLTTGGVYGKSGSSGAAGAAGTGAGGGGGSAGLIGITGTDTKGNTYIGRNPTAGGAGYSGGSGFCIIKWDK